MRETETILLQIEQAFRRRSWHGTNLMGSLRGIDVETAAWRPARGRHNIWELIVHAAYWKYSVHRRLVVGSRPRFELKGSNWFKRPIEMSEVALKADIALLKEHHQRLIEAGRAFPDEKLDSIPKGSSTTYRDLLIGGAAHDLYHAGQIQLIKRLRT